MDDIGGASGSGAGAGAGTGATKRVFESKLIPGPEEYSAAADFLGPGDGALVDADVLPAPDMERALAAFWEEEKGRSRALLAAPSSEAAEIFKYANDLPLARIKRIMKSDEDVRMISAEAPVLFAKACELFIADLSIRSWCYTTEDKGKRRTLTREDVCTAVQQTDIFDFLVEVLLPQGTKAQYVLDAEAAAEGLPSTRISTAPVSYEADEVESPRADQVELLVGLAESAGDDAVVDEMEAGGGNVEEAAAL